jgi:DNA-binding beta-propeller fold protein YncE
VWVDRSGVVYVADFGSSAVRVFDRSGVLIRTIPVARPLGLTVSADGLLYVTDDHHHQVRVYDAMGTLVRSFGRQGSAPGEFQHPHGIALGPDGDVYVADRGNARVQAFTPEGIVRRTFASTDEHRPFAPAGVCVTPDRRLLAADTASHRVLAWSLADR